ncbi:MAG: hypothetical protein EAZ07_04630 [Cytophagales bacterium]|nr:MAG: hypothetical protein EAZ07_04630 [Cytophagales bacterium]
MKYPFVVIFSKINIHSINPKEMKTILIRTNTPTSGNGHNVKFISIDANGDITTQYFNYNNNIKISALYHLIKKDTLTI